MIVSCYAMIEALAIGRGLNPDVSRHLTRMIETT